jgi:hypothetical protein
MSRVKTNRSVE